MVRVWFEAFVLTQVIEVPIYSAGIAGRWWKRIAVAFGASAITHPVIWFVLVPWITHYWTMLVTAELFALVTEAVYLRLWGVRRAWAWALGANATSVALGMLYYAIRGSPW